MGADPNVRLARRILGWIRRNPIERFSKRDCHQAHRNIGKPTELDPGLEILEGRGFIRPVPPAPREQKRGQPSSPEYEVNPYTQNTHNTQKYLETPNSEYSVISE